MKRTVLSIALITLLAGCQQSSEPEAPASSAETKAPMTTPEPVEETATATPEPVISETQQLADRLFDVLGSEHRSEDNRARDRYRNPAPTLTFFGLQPSFTVIEINPGGGWYSEIVAPVVNGQGQYIAAMIDPGIEGAPGYAARQAEGMQTKLAEQSEHYGSARVQLYNPAEPEFGDAGSADMVLTFRNVHGWINGGQAETMFQAFFTALKPGGTLGVVQHRAAADADVSESSANGYVPEAAVIALAEEAGFEFVERAEINANAKDTRDHPRGVWSLPPTLAPDEGANEEAIAASREARSAIGESDRMTLRFVKPQSDEIFTSD